MGKKKEQIEEKKEYKTACNVFGLGVAGTVIELTEKEAVKYGKSIVLYKGKK